MRIPLIAGRDLDEHDGSRSDSVALINQSFAHQYFPRGDAVGKRIRQGYAGDENPYRIVGVIGDTRRDSPAIPPAPEALLAVAQTEPGALELVIRTRLANPLRLVPDLVAAVRHLDPDVPVYDLRGMEWYLDYQTADRRFPALLLSGFGGIAMVLAGIGLFGLMSSVVSQRTRELHVRIALGAPPGSVIGMIMGQGLRLVAAGRLLGLAGAWALNRFIAALLFATQPNDGVTFIGTAGLLLMMAGLACWRPARRAATIDPVVTLRAE